MDTVPVPGLGLGYLAAGVGFLQGQDPDLAGALGQAEHGTVSQL